MRVFNTSGPNIPLRHYTVERKGLINKDVNGTATWDENAVVTENINVSGQLNINPDLNIYISACGGSINVNSNSTITIGNNTTFFGYSEDNVLNIDGAINIGNNVSFSSYDSFLWQGLKLNNPFLSLNINYSSFKGCDIKGVTNEIQIQNTLFDNSFADLSNGDITISNCTFNNNSKVHISHPANESKTINILNSSFSNTSDENAISIEYYPNYYIYNNTISNCNSGIFLSNSGYGKGSTEISSNSISNNILTGITVYSSTTILRDNNVSNNNIGLKLLDKCSSTIEGNNEVITQEFSQNNSYQMYITKGSFPHKIRYNKISDNDNTVCWVEYTGSEEGLNVQYNNWGGSYVPENNLCPTGAYIIEPIWDPGDTGIDSEAEAMFNGASNLVQQEDYTGAKAQYQQVVLQYPDTKFAQAALKELVNLEKYAGNDYTELKSYYETEPAIQNNPQLVKLADFLANRCNIKLANWPDAISWFENVIQNPESTEDSIFAIIDLSYTYWLMQNGGLKSSNYVGTMSQYKFTDYATFEENRDYLLSLLPGDDLNLSESMKQKVNALNGGELLQNVPNPFNGSTRIFYKLTNDATVKVTIFDYTGKQIKTYTEGEKSSGVHSVVFDAKGLTPGMYFYSIEVNGVRSDSKKMIVE